LLFAYAGDERVTVALHRTGCRQVTNGDLLRIGIDTPVAGHLFSELLRLTAPESGDAGVTGLVRLCGGPPPGHCFSQDGDVTALDAAGEVVVVQATTRARFTFALPPGTYTLVATSGGATGRHTVTLAAGRTLRESIVVSIK
jgi:hypothetical protein